MTTVVAGHVVEGSGSLDNHTVDMYPVMLAPLQMYNTFVKIKVDASHRLIKD